MKTWQKELLYGLKVMKIWPKELLYCLIAVNTVLTLVLEPETEISEELWFLSRSCDYIYIAILILVLLDLFKIAKNIFSYKVPDSLLPSIHEAGHVVVALLVGFNVDACNIKATLTTGGSTIVSYPALNTFRTREMYLNFIKITYGGKCAEEILLGAGSTGSENDLRKATRWCKDLVCKSGMGEHVLVTSGDENLDKIILEKNFEIMVNTSQKCYEETYKLIENNQGLVKDLAEILIKKKQLTQEELELLKKTHNLNS